ncbi:MAG: hypothetical protein MRERV_7c069 [Mycoplasmataceae bacterium RV_VA103A]|nr:MAG: hypothetical protein MRERV_7c069 [Mycoplasmataceae bacterium RV_VA103A]
MTKLFCSHSSTPCEYCHYSYLHNIEAYLLTTKKCPQHKTKLIHYYGDTVIYCPKGKEIFKK